MRRVKIPEQKPNINGFEFQKADNKIEFPLFIFPPKIENIIKRLEDAAGFEKSVSAASILFTVSTIIGNSKTIKVKSVWKDTPNIWIAIIGRRGTMKTPTINFGINPLKQDEKTYSERFESEIAVYNETKKEDRSESKRPIRQQRYSNDVTVEGLIRALKENPNGMGIFKDELNGFFEEMSRYKSGGNLEFYLSAFSGGLYTKNRASYDTITIDDIFLSIIGSIQPEVLKSVSATNTVNGMIDRWLFVESENGIYEFNFDDLDPKFVLEYNNFIDEIKTISKINDELVWSIEGIDSFKEGMNGIETLMKDDNTSDQIYTYLSKMKTYFARFCALIPVMWGSLTIDKFHVEYAFSLITFFINTALNTFLEFENTRNIENIYKIENASTQKQKVMAICKHLPELKVTEIAKLVGCSRSYASTTVNK